MHGAIKVFGAILIVFIITSLSIMAVVWVIPEIEKSMELSEFQTVRNQFYDCNDKIMETARIGSTNKCFFSAGEGRLTVDIDGIYYKITTGTGICDQHPWVLINEEKHIWQKCEVSDQKRILEMKWSFPLSVGIEGWDFAGDKLKGDPILIGNIIFDSPVSFGTSTFYVEFQTTAGESGNVIEISRVDVKTDKIILKIRVL